MSNPTRNGKIAQLPLAIREEINRRLADGRRAKALVPWLNGLPEVQTLIATEFDGHPIREQNLSQWKRGGFQDWLRTQEAMALARYLHESAQELKAQNPHASEAPVPFSEVLTTWLGSRIGVATREVERAEGDERWRKLRQICVDVVRLRRSDQQAEWLALQRQRNEIQRQRLELQRERLQLSRTQAEMKCPRRARANGAFAAVAVAGVTDPGPASRRPATTHSPSPTIVFPPTFDVLLTEEQKVARWRDILEIAA